MPWHGLIGFFITKRRPSNYLEGMPRRYGLICSEGYERTSTSTGKRKNTKSLKDCMWKAKAIILKNVGAWKFFTKTAFFNDLAMNASYFLISKFSLFFRRILKIFSSSSKDDLPLPWPDGVVRCKICVRLAWWDHDPLCG